MPREKQVQPAIVHGYELPDKAIPDIVGHETLVWYLEPDAQEQANKLAGSMANVKLPYFFCGSPPEEGKRWPKHRRGGLAFVRNWLAALAGDKLDRDATAVTAKKPVLKQAAERAADVTNRDKEAAQKLAEAADEAARNPTAAGKIIVETERKLKAERKTVRGLRKDLKAAESALLAIANKGANDLGQRAVNQQILLNDMDTTHREQRLALRRILDRAQVAFGVVNRLPLATDLAHRRRDHALAELRSIRELAKEMLPGTPEAQRDDGAAG